MDNSEKNVNKDSFSVQKPKSIILLSIIVGIIGVLFSGTIIALMIIFPNDTTTFLVFFIFIFLTLFSFLLVFIGFLFKRWKVQIDGRQIKYTPFIGDEKQFTFDSFSKVQSISHSGFAVGIAEIKFYIGGKSVFTVGSSFRGFTTLLSHLDNENISFS